MRYVAALLALLTLGLSFLAKSPGVAGFLILFCVLATLTSLVGFVSNRVSANTRSQVYLPTAEERALLARRNERMKKEFEQRREQGQRLEPEPRREQAQRPEPESRPERGPGSPPASG